ncbi:regucalcin-like [Belonocnema kinseyi]|uniref:regucalcin-like n=1 Tax=Belonocnema kinseyi TaxID=2817044 RepID=UPI00143E0B1F|nr:regucalcin-like [Belonocnema kinseyi]
MIERFEDLNSWHLRNCKKHSQYSAFHPSVICQPGSEQDRKPSLIHDLKPSLLHDVKPNLPHSGQSSSQHNPVHYNGPVVIPITHRVGGVESLFYRNGQLFFTDDFKHEFCAYLDSSEEIFCTFIGLGTLSFAVPVAHHSDHFVLGYNNKITLIDWNSLTNNSLRKMKIYNVIHLHENESFNYGIADPLHGLCIWSVKKGEPVSGRVWTFHPLLPAPQLVEQMLPGIPVTNGIVWSLSDPTKLYCINNRNNVIHTFIYNVGERRVVGEAGIAFDLEHWAQIQRPPLYYGHAMLGRMTIDTKGRLWVPLYGGSHVIQINPNTRAVLQAIHIPAARVSACIFGGPKLDILYVSTVTFGADEQHPAGDQGGMIYAVSNIVAKGQAARPFNMQS